MRATHHCSAGSEDKGEEREGEERRASELEREREQNGALVEKISSGWRRRSERVSGDNWKCSDRLEERKNNKWPYYAPFGKKPKLTS